MDKIALLVWAALWLLGGLWLTQAAFRLQHREALPVGITLGLLLQNLLVNTLAQLLPLPAAVWLASGLVFAAGLVSVIWKTGWRALFKLPILPGQVLLLLFLFGLSYAINISLPLFDDYAHLPTVSILAAGEIPPHFPLDPAAPYAYHYFLLLFAAQPVRLGWLSPWVALDISRALVFALAITLTAVWAQRLTRSTAAAWLAGAAAVFVGGTRWLLLFFSREGLNNLAEGVKLIGSGIATGPNLQAAMGNIWAIESHPDVNYPFAFGSGLFSSGVMGMLGPNSLMILAVLAVLLLTATRWRGWLAVAITALIFAALSFTTEGELIYLYLAFGLLALIVLIRSRSLRLPRRLGQWLMALGFGALLGLFQGGAIFDVVLRLLRGESSSSYHTVSFSFHAVPTLISRQIGSLSLLNPGQLLIALAEAGPILLVLPLLFIWARKAWRVQRWFEATIGLGAALSLGMLFIYYSGSEGEANTTRLYAFFLFSLLYAAPLLWMWGSHRARATRITLGILGVAACLGGIVYFSFSLFGMSKPLPSNIINELDSQIFARQWNRLPDAALVFDIQPNRAPVVFGRYSNSSINWYTPKPEWQQLAQNPLPGALQQAGYDYAYIDPDFWSSIQANAVLRAAWEDGCITLVDEAVNLEKADFRRLLRLQSCGK